MIRKKMATAATMSRTSSKIFTLKWFCKVSVASESTALVLLVVPIQMGLEWCFDRLSLIHI